MSEPIDIGYIDKTDFMKVGGSFLSNINYKVAFIIYFIGVLLFSDIFIDGVLSEIPNTISGECTTTKGTMLQLLFLTLAYIVVDLLVKYEVL